MTWYRMKWVPAIVAVGAAFLLGVGAVTDSLQSRTASSVALNPNHDCAYCHNLHGGSSMQLLANPVVEALCLTCHGPSGTSVLKVANHVYDNSTCTDCHVSHSNVRNWLGGTNLKLVRDSVIGQEGNSRPVVFESRGTNEAEPTLHSFCDGDEDGNGVWDGVCDTCHSDVGRHTYTESNKHGHQQGATCTRCHEHVLQFKTE